VKGKGDLEELGLNICKMLGLNMSKILKFNVYQTGQRCVDSRHVVQDKVQWRIPVNTVVKLSLSHKLRNSLNNYQLYNNDYYSAYSLLLQSTVYSAGVQIFFENMKCKNTGCDSHIIHDAVFPYTHLHQTLRNLHTNGLFCDNSTARFTVLTAEMENV
jgi:hypothetical protein